jgi:hypothetical protein
MNTKSPYALGTVLFLSLLLALPADIWALPQGTEPRAGEVSRVIPAVSIARGSQKITASTKSVVYWKDLVNTQVNARARIALDDGSVLNVGSESSMTVTQHDAGAQQTSLDLAYGKLRTQAQKISKPDGKFEVHTPAGVAGVVGTDFFAEYDLATQTMNVLVFDGHVKVCNLAGVCVDVKAGQFTNVRTGNNNPPLAPAQASLDVLTSATHETEIGGVSPVVAVQQLHHISKATLVVLGVVAAVPVAVVPIASHSSTSTTPVRSRCPNPANCG